MTDRLEKIVIIKLVLFVLRFGQRLVLFYSVEKELNQFYNVTWQR